MKNALQIYLDLSKFGFDENDNPMISVNDKQFLTSPQGGSIGDVLTKVGDDVSWRPYQSLPLTPISTNTTYAELKSLRDSNSLNPNTLYRITDYVTTSVQDDTRSVGHQFDVIVLAISTNQLSENAYAIQPEGDTYFATSKLNAQQIKYCLDNNTDVYEWADETNGKGVIYYMRDEHNIEMPYDFKNIQFKRFKVINYPIYTNLVGRYIGVDSWMSGPIPTPLFKYGFTEIDYDDYRWYYTFSENIFDDSVTTDDVDLSIYDESSPEWHSPYNVYIYDNATYLEKHRLLNNVFYDAQNLTAYNMYDNTIYSIYSTVIQYEFTANYIEGEIRDCVILNYFADVTLLKNGSTKSELNGSTINSMYKIVGTVDISQSYIGTFDDNREPMNLAVYNSQIYDFGVYDSGKSLTTPINITFDNCIFGGTLQGSFKINGSYFGSYIHLYNALDDDSTTISIEGSNIYPLSETYGVRNESLYLKDNLRYNVLMSVKDPDGPYTSSGMWIMHSFLNGSKNKKQNKTTYEWEDYEEA